MNVLGTLGVIFLASFLVEALVEATLGQVFDKVAKLAQFKWTLMYAAMVVGVVGAFIYSFDLIHLLGEWLNAPMPVHPFGEILTGLAIGRGSNFIHDLITKFFAKA